MSLVGSTPTYSDVILDMFLGYDSVHIRANLPRLEEALKYGHAAGDRIYTSFANVHIICTRFYIGDHRAFFSFMLLLF
jgi:hypothetical protein